MVPLEAEASGLIVLTHDGRVWRRLTEDLATIEQELLVGVEGRLAPYGLHKLAQGLTFEGRELPPCKVSWQNETTRRFAITGVMPGQLRAMCAQVGLAITTLRETGRKIGYTRDHYQRVLHRFISYFKPEMNQLGQNKIISSIK